MRRVLALGGAALLLVAVLLASSRDEERVATAHGAPAQAARARAGERTALADTRLAPARAGAHARPEPVERPRESAVVRLLELHSTEELALFARFERLTGRAATPELLELVRRRRAGARSDELTDAATRLFEGDPLGRAAALEWIRTSGR